MSIKKLSRKHTTPPRSNLTIRMLYDRMSSDRMTSDRMGPDRMGSDKGPGSLAGGLKTPVAQNHVSQRSKDVHQEDSSEN